MLPLSLSVSLTLFEPSLFGETRLVWSFDGMSVVLARARVLLTSFPQGKKDVCHS